MSFVEKIDDNKMKITFSVDADRFEEGMKYSYNKNKNHITIQGFRKGKAPRKLIEAHHGKEIFYNDAFNYVFPEAYEKAIKENNLDVVSKPTININEVNDKKGVVFTADVYIKPEVIINEYKGISYTKKAVNVTDEDINAQIDAIREQNARIVTINDRPIQEGDIATIDFKGIIDGVPFKGGEEKDYDLTIGSHQFIAGFEEQLIGHNVGDDVDVNLNFPEDYHQKDLAGKPATFKVEIKDIKYKQLPEIDDDFVQDISDFNTVDEYKNDIKEKLLVKKNREIEVAKQEELIANLIEKAEMNVPNVMIENEIDAKINEFKDNLARQGLTLDMYLRYMGQSIQNMREAYRIVSEKLVKGRLVLEAIAAKENIEVTNEEIDAEIERMANSYKLKKENIKSIITGEEQKNLINDLKVQKALNLVMENAIEA